MRYFMIDRVTELVVGERIRGIKNVTLSDEVVNDHFPDFPVLPGALVLEACAQLAGYLVEATFAKPGQRPMRALMAQVKDAKFHDTCAPGDQLDIVATLDSRLDAAAQVTAEVKVGQKRVARAQITFILKDVDSERIHEQRRYFYRIWTRDLKPPAPIP